MINRVVIKGYKSIKSMDLELAPINILLGANGVGKSNLISVFSLIKSIYNRNLQSYIQKKGQADSLLHFGKKNTSKIHIALEIQTDTHEENKFIIDLALAQDSLFIETLKTAYKHNNIWTAEREHEANVRESNFQHIKWEEALWVDSCLKDFDVYHFHDTSDTSAIKSASDINDNRYFKQDGSNLASFLYYLKQIYPQNFKRIELMVQSIAPFLERFVLEPQQLNSQKINLEWVHKGFPEQYFNAYHISDGTLRFICLAVLLMQPNPPKTIIIDEPELGLHPVAINKLAALIRKVSETSQVILATQSVNLIDNFEPEDIIVTDRKENATLFRRLKSQELHSWLEEYSLGDLWGKNKFGAQPYSV
jgi:predicted ATPase